MRPTIVSDKHKFLFVHVPRTGGTSVRFALRDYCETGNTDGNEIHGGQGWQAPVGRYLSVAAKGAIMRSVQATPFRFLITTRGHPTAALTLLCNRRLRSYRRFAFVRNPYDRIVSAYECARKYEGYAGGFDDYVRNCRVHLQPQANFLFLLGKNFVDWTGRFERIEEDFAGLCDWLGVPRVALPLTNTAEYSDSRDYLTPTLRRRITDVYAGDFAAFGYSLSH